MVRSKFRKVLINQKGFTLIELITVIVVLGIIMGIGLPRYAIIQAQAEWDADVTTLDNLIRATEVLYATDKTVGTLGSDGYVLIGVEFLHKAGLFDGGTVLNRIREGLLPDDDAKTKSIRNTAKIPLFTEVSGAAMYDIWLKINPDTGKVVTLFGTWDWYEHFIGKRPGS